jgi:rhomboid family GlyGly-CTERM serine protease
MGLRHGDLPPYRARIFAGWVVPAGITLVVVALGLLGDSGREWLAIDRAAISGGEYWRLVTGHLVHLGTPHLVYNLIGLWLIWYLVGQELRPRHWGLVLFAGIAAVSTGLWFFSTDLNWYVGLSGVQHGLLVGGLASAAGRWGVDLWIVAIAIAAKLLFEQTVGPMPGSEASSGGAVIVDAHLYGAVAGALVGGALGIRVRARASI